MDDRCGATPLYRLLNVGPDAHFYTTSAAERDNALNNLAFEDQGRHRLHLVGPVGTRPPGLIGQDATRVPGVAAASGAGRLSERSRPNTRRSVVPQDAVRYRTP